MTKSIQKRRKRLLKLFEGLAGGYVKDRFLHSLGTQYENKLEIETVKSSLKYIQNDQNNKILDVGIGEARISRELAFHGCEIIGIDISPNMLRYSSDILNQQKYGQKSDFVLSSMSHLPFRENCFDAVISIRNLKYSINPFKVIQEFHHVMNKEGIFIVEFPNIKTYYSLLITLDKLMKKKIQPIRAIWQYFSIVELSQKLRSIGFEILDFQETLRLPKTLYRKVDQKNILKTVISIEKALSWILPQGLLTRSFIITCRKSREPRAYYFPR